MSQSPDLDCHNDSHDLLALFDACLELDADARLHQRCLRTARLALASPALRAKAITEAGRPNDYKALTRWLANPNVDLHNLRDALARLSWQRARRCPSGSMIAAYDPTYLDFKTHSDKLHKRAFSSHQGAGYIWLPCALFDPGTRNLMGIAQQTLVDARGCDDRHLLDLSAGLDPDPEDELLEQLHKEYETNERFRYAAQIAHAARHFPEDISVLHAADALFDDVASLRHLDRVLPEHHDFVVRSDMQRVVAVAPEELAHPPAPEVQRPHNRRIPGQDLRGMFSLKIADLPELLEYRPCGCLELNSQGRLAASQAEVVERVELERAAIRVKLYRKSTRGERLGLEEEPLWVTLVLVRNRETQKVHWALLTSLPKQYAEEAVQGYACRYDIEGMFRSYKQYMELETTRLRHPERLAKLLIFGSLRLMKLEWNRELIGLKVGRKPTKEQRLKLREKAEQARQIEQDFWLHREMPPELDEEEKAWMRLGLMAALGGWLFKAGRSLGNQVLLKGQAKLAHDAEFRRFLWLVDPDAFQDLLDDMGY